MSVAGDALPDSANPTEGARSYETFLRVLWMKVRQIRTGTLDLTLCS